MLDVPLMSIPNTGGENDTNQNADGGNCHCYNHSLRSLAMNTSVGAAMSTPTQAQIEAAAKAIECELSRGGSEPETVAVAALTAAAEVGKDDNLAIRYGMQTGGDLWKATIERCACKALEQRCERNTTWDLACTTIAAAIRALKDQ